MPNWLFISGDNLTGERGNGDDETIPVSLNHVPAKYNKLYLFLKIFMIHIIGKQHFGMIRNAYIRIINRTNNQELIRYNLSEDYHGPDVINYAGEIYRHNDE